MNSAMNLVKECLQSKFNSPIQTRVCLDDLNQDTLPLLWWLWDNRYQIIVASEDTALINQINSTIINLSGSMGRWRVVTYSQALIEPSDCFIYYKELTNDQLLRIPTKATCAFKASTPTTDVSAESTELPG